MKTVLLYLVPCLLTAFPVFAADTFVNDLLPKPQQLVVQDDALSLAPTAWRIVLTAPTKDALTRLKERTEESLKELNITARINTKKSKDFTIQFLRTSSKIKPSPLNMDAAPAALKEQAYALSVTKKGVAIQANAEQGLFYGMMTLEQLIRSAQTRKQEQLPALQISDWPALQMRGFSEDYGRDQLPTMEEHKRLIRLMARFKINTYLWFIEPDHFIYAFDPNINTEYDRFSFDEIRELVAYAKQYYIEVIPTVELLGHMEMLLKNEKYKKFAEMPEGGGDLCPTSDEAFELVRKMEREIAAAFSGRYFHCGLDESYGIGKGRSAEAVKTNGIERVFANYYTKMDELVKSHNHTMMMYADIVLNHPNMLPMLSKDIVMMFWDYAPRDEYPGLKLLKDSNHPTTALSGLWSWNNLYPFYMPAFKNMESLAKQAVRDGSLGHFVSGWGDGYKGAAGFNLSELDLYGVMYCGAVSWKPESIPMADYSAAFATQFFGCADSKLADALTRLAQCQGENTNRSTQARFLFNSDALETVFAMSTAKEEDIVYWQNIQKETQAVVDVLAAVQAPQNDDYLRTTRLAADMLKCAADMAMTCRGIAVDGGKPDFDRAQYATKLETLANRHQTLKEQYNTVWCATNRPLNLERINTMWSPTIDELRSLAADIRSCVFPAPVQKVLKTAFTFDGKGNEMWRDSAGAALNLAPAGDGPAPEVKPGGPSGKGGFLSLQHGARCEVVDTNRVMDFRTGPFLVEAWVRHTGQPEQQYGSTIFSYGLGGGWRLGLNHKGEALFTLYGISDMTGTHSIVPPDGKWHHIAVNFHHCSKIDYYIDGALTDQLELKGFPKSPGNPLVRVGNEIGLVTSFVGDIDRIRVSAGLYEAKELDAKP